MDRYTQADANKAFRRLATKLGKPTQTGVVTENGYHSIVGAWALDYNSVYGGCIVEEIINEQGGVTHPLTTERVSPRVFCQMVNFALRAMAIENGYA